MSDVNFENWTMEKTRIWAGTEDTEAALAEYAEVAAWCNEQGNYTIVEDGEFYKVAKIEETENIENME